MNFKNKNSCQNYAFFWPYFYDSPAPDRPLIQMKNQERGEGTALSNSPLMATRVQAWDRHWDWVSETWNVDHTKNIKCKVFRHKLSFLFIKTRPEETRNNIKEKTPLSASSDYASAMNVQQQNLNTVKSLLHQLFVKRSLRKLNQITKKKKSHFSNVIEWKTPSNHWRGGSKWVGEGEGGNGPYVE